MSKVSFKESNELLTQDEIEIVKTYHNEVARLRGYQKNDWNGIHPELMTGSYNLIIKLGGGCPIKAAQVRRKMETRQDWTSDLPDFMKAELGLLTPEITDTSSS